MMMMMKNSTLPFQSTPASTAGNSTSTTAVVAEISAVGGGYASNGFPVEPATSDDRRGYHPQTLLKCYMERYISCWPVWTRRPHCITHITDLLQPHYNPHRYPHCNLHCSPYTHIAALLQPHRNTHYYPHRFAATCNTHIANHITILIALQPYCNTHRNPVAAISQHTSTPLRNSQPTLLSASPTSQHT